MVFAHLLLLPNVMTFTYGFSNYKTYEYEFNCLLSYLFHNLK